MKPALPLISAALFFLSACGQGSSYTLVLPETPRPASLPQQLEYAGETYQLQQWNGKNGEYYRSGEQGYNWQNLLTLSLTTQGEQLADFAQVMKAQLARENTVHEVQAVDQHVEITALYPPQPGNAQFSGYESNLMRYQSLPCGLTGLQYAEQHPASADGQQLFASAKAAQSSFQTYAGNVLAAIRCPDNSQ